MEWKDVIGFENTYEVSSFGDVRRKSTRRILTKQIDKDGYFYVLLYNKKHFKRFIHRLVLEAFDHIRIDGNVVCHNDGNPKNNYILNLRWDTIKGNKDDEKKHGTALFGEKLSWTKLTKDDVFLIRRMLSKNIKQTIIASKFNISPSTICDIKMNRTWRYL